MRVHWEKLGILGPFTVWSANAVAITTSPVNKVSEDNVRRCVAWLLLFGSHASRTELIRHASPVPKIC